MARAKELVEKYETTIIQIKKLCKTKPVNPKFFNSNNGGLGFLDAFLQSLGEMGFRSIREIVNPNLESLRLPLHQFARAIADLDQEDLVRLKKIHFHIENHRSEHSKFPSEFKNIAKFFENTKLSTNDTLEAGRLILLVSTIADVIFEFKNQLNDFEDVLIDFRDLHIRVHTDTIDFKGLVELDVSRHTIDFLLDNLRDDIIEFSDFEDFKNELKAIKRDFLEVIIRYGKQFEKKFGGKVNSANRQIGAWLEWEKMMQFDEKFMSKHKRNEVFQVILSEFKCDMGSHVQTLEALTTRILNNTRNNKRISSFFIEIIDDIDQLVHGIIKYRLPVDMKMRRRLRELSATISKTRSALKKSLNEENETMELFPEIIKKRLHYFNQEIPTVLSRRNKKEIRFMLFVLNASFRNIENLIKTSLKGAPTVKTRKICSLLRQRYLEIIYNSLDLLKDSSLDDMRIVI